MTIKKIEEYIKLDATSPSGLRWIKKPSVAVNAGDPALCYENNGYYVGIFNGKHFRAHRVVWFLCNGEWPNGQIDHINGNSLDNSISNLRDVNRSINMKNRRLSSNNKTGKNGVWLNKTNGTYRAAIRTRFGRIYLGTFNTVDEASMAVSVAMNMDGEFSETHGRNR